MELVAIGFIYLFIYAFYGFNTALLAALVHHFVL